MAIQPIRLFGDPVLVTPAAPVTDFDKEIRQLVADLMETMHDAPGAGLAAVPYTHMTLPTNTKV